MGTVLKKIYNFFNELRSKLLPEGIVLRSNAEDFSIDQSMQFAGKCVTEKDVVLDAGAGSQPYKKYFDHAVYESTDFDNMFDQNSRGRHTFICSLDDIPKPENTYDVIINTQVLEHVEYPQKVIHEFFRVLKPGGKLFLTAPQGWGIHDGPYHFFNFTNFGLESLFHHAGFKIEFIRPRGGMFWYLGKRIKTLPSYIFFQYMLQRREGEQSWDFRPTWRGFVLLPFYLIALPFCTYFIPLLFFYLDRLDKKQDYTLGYFCYCVKPKKN